MRAGERLRGKGVLSRIFLALSIVMLGVVCFFPAIASLSWHALHGSEAAHLGWTVHVPKDWLAWNINGKWHLVALGKNVFSFKPGMFEIDEPRAWWNAEKHYERSKVELERVFGPGALSRSEKEITIASVEGYCKEFRRKDWSDVLCYSKDGWGFSYHGSDLFLTDFYQIISNLKR
ncbi:MAG: hypothetical protein ABIP12_05155 [Terriglobales bacterium]